MAAREQAGSATPGATPGRPHMLAAFEALRAPAFRYLWINNFTFFLVSGIQRFAFVWLALELTNDSASAAGFVTFALGVPVLFVSLPAGVLSDRMNRRTLLIVGQAGMFAMMALTAVLVWTGAMNLWLAVLMAVGAGASIAVAQPVRTAIVPSIVDRERLMNAIVVMSMGMNVSLIVGPFLGGAAIALFGIGGSFALQAVIILGGGLLLIPLRVPQTVPAASGARGSGGLREGLAFVAGHRAIAVLIVMLVLSGLLMIGPNAALVPQIAKEELGAEAFAASALLGFMGVGTLITSTLLASIREFPRKGAWFLASVTAGGIIFAFIGLSSTYALTAALMLAWGMGGGIFINLNQTLVQANTPQELMGRVMSIHTLGFLGLTPMGALLAGGMASLIGAPLWVGISGFMLAAFGAIALATQRPLRELP